MAGEIHVGDIGTILRLTIVDQDGVAVDVSVAAGQTTMEILFKGPDKEMTKTAVYQTDGTNGVIQWVLLSGDISAFGKWKMQGHIVITTGEWHTTAVEFDVLDIII